MDLLGAFVNTFLSLFPIINPVGMAPVFMSMTKEYPAEIRQRMTLKISLYSFMLLAGSAILSFLGLSIGLVKSQAA